MDNEFYCCDTGWSFMDLSRLPESVLSPLISLSMLALSWFRAASEVSLADVDRVGGVTCELGEGVCVAGCVWATGAGVLLCADQYQ